MTLPSWWRETVTRLRAPYVTDEYGNESSTRDWSQAVSLAITPCTVQPLTGGETLGERDARTKRWSLYAPPLVDVLPTDRIVHQGATYEIKGEVRQWVGASGRLDHTHIELEKVDG
jgi:hypothetical protein